MSIKKSSWEDDSDSKNFTRVESQKYDNSNNSLIFDIRDRTNIIVKKFQEKVLYKNCTFTNVYFKNAILKDIRFIDCKFERCIFENCRGYYQSRIVFEDCFLHMTKFIKCNFRDLAIFRSVLKSIDFVDTKLNESVFYNNCYYLTRFVDDCDISGMVLYKTTFRWEMEFVEETSITKMDYLTKIGPFDYSSKYHIDKEYDVMCLTSKEYDVSRTLLNFQRLFRKNDIPLWHSNCFYNCKYAEQRNSRGLKRFLLWLSNAICGFGEKPFNALVFSVFIIITFSIIYMFSGFTTDSGVIKYYIISSTPSSFNMILADYIKSLYFSFISFITIGFSDIKISGMFTTIFFCLEILCGVIFITIFTSTLVRRMTR